ncbi:lysophospholipid acyltransferase family protein [Singulisphaera acidiphila]|uniref:1-acyl-sn-glycerol-3-phosphate acyltransferase n=1 Tax=Singulisphaera acidiphila (strain ATCC BAA-1392 / DSM 18658 / VKM B-2454 / MOB10) TaxID=886293 RepID=L0DCJ9_SINAD|nr:lysophospholipid acyltransferase family protein [Singulisphaera acidiphila]AGA26568.1 1-acyl-sn-glycerol-3-phosphate acyltransferase [Singulisphaera acidiphila DSM 18658]
MNPGLLLSLTAAVLAGPWILMPTSSVRPEISGLLRPLDWLNRLYCGFWHRLQLENRCLLPERGPALLIANHTCSVDHMLLQAGCRRVLGFMIAREYFENRALRPICVLLGCIPVRRDGQDLAATRAALRALEQGKVVPVFPEGRILPTSGRDLGPGRQGVAFLALHAQVPVIPAFICGTPATNEVWKSLSTPSHSRVIFGPPVDLSDMPSAPPFDRTVLTTVTERLMDAIRTLQKQLLSEDDALGNTADRRDNDP